MTDYTIKFPPNSKVYIIAEARKGTIKYVYIKKFDLKIEAKTYGQPIVLYTDTLNGLWNENELCSETQAISLASAYYEKIIHDIDELTS